MYTEIDDPVSVIKMIDDIGERVSELKEMVPPMTMTAIGVHGPKQIDALEDVLDTIHQCRIRVMSDYGRMLWDSADGPREIAEREDSGAGTKKDVNKSHGKDDVRDVSHEVLSQIFLEARAEAIAKAAQDGERIQPGAREVEPPKRKRLVRRVLGRASRRKVQRPEA